MQEMCRIVHNDYHRISDKVMWLSPEYILKFNVDLYYNRQVKGQHEKVRENFHRELGYTFDNEHRIKILRDFTYYLTIEPTRNNLPNKRVIIGINSIYFLKYKLETVIESWFRDSSPFVRKNGHIMIPSSPGSITVQLDFNGYLEFEPAVVLENGKEGIGVKIFVNSESDWFVMSINSFLSFQYLISNFNMYQSAQLMLAYFGRPENGTNYTELNTSVEAPNGFFNRVAQQYDPSGG